MSGDLFSFFSPPAQRSALSASAEPMSHASPAPLLSHGKGKRRPVPFLVHDGEGGDPRTITPRGRDAWALSELLAAGTTGCTPIERVGPRWSHYIFKLRTVYGLNVETITEPHGGEVQGHSREICVALAQIRPTLPPLRGADNERL